MIAAAVVFCFIAFLLCHRYQHNFVTTLYMLCTMLQSVTKAELLCASVFFFSERLVMLQLFEAGSFIGYIKQVRYNSNTFQ